MRCIVAGLSSRRLFSPRFVSSLGLLVQQLRRMAFSVEERGSRYSTDYCVYFKREERYISPMHDIRLFPERPGPVVNMVVEIPRWTNAKMEINKEEPLNPIKQDVKKGKVRFVNNCFPYHGYIWNYGALPQTWEDPNHVDQNTAAKGDNDPLDVCEIGSHIWSRGEVRQVKVLGTVALIDEGETDWKILAIDVADLLAEKLNDIGDIDTHMPGFLKATVEWFRIYKMPTGKPPNQFAFNGEAKDQAFAMGIVQETHAQWQALVENKCDSCGVSCSNTAVAGSPYQITPDKAQEVVSKAPPATLPQPLDPMVHKWDFVSQ